MHLFWLDPRQPDGDFPHPENALQEPNGLLAMGGDLSPTRLLKAYSWGIFPWYDQEDIILWWSPQPRTVFHTDHIYISRRFARVLRQDNYTVTLDRAFEQVINQCAALREQEGTWLGLEMRHAYMNLHKMGHAHSVEVWRRGQLIGGLYGVAYGQVFCGESMFSTHSNASKIALVWLVRQLHAWGYVYLDGQVGSPHLYHMGAVDIPRAQFLQALEQPKPTAVPNGYWQFTIGTPTSATRLE